MRRPIDIRLAIPGAPMTLQDFRQFYPHVAKTTPNALQNMVHQREPSSQLHVPMANVIPCSPWSPTTFETTLGERLIANRDTDTRCQHLVATDQLPRHALDNFHRACIPHPDIRTVRRAERLIHTSQSTGRHE